MTHTQISLTTADGACPTHVIHPDGAGPWPGVLLYMDGLGMRPAVVEIAQRLADGGYYVLAPDLFYRVGPYTTPDPKQLFADEKTRTEWWSKIMPHASAVTIMRDTEAFLAYFASEKQVRPGKIGVTGYCMGGRASIVAAGTYPDRFACAAAYHPGGLVTDAPDSPHLLAPKITARVYVGGAMEDANFTDAHAKQLDAALAAAGVEHQVETYAARHGWVPSDTPVHDAAAAEKHWQTLFALLERSLA